MFSVFKILPMTGFELRTSGIGNDHSANCSITNAQINKNVWRSPKISGQSYKHFMLVNYDSRVVPDWKIPHIMTLES